MAMIPATPLVSIVTPVLNGRKYLEECVQSVLAQSYPRIEHVFVDGGSVDGTAKALDEYRAEYPSRIRIISEPGSTPGGAWNIGLKAAKGDIFGCIGIDDLYEEGAIEAVVAYFFSHPDAQFLHGDCYRIDETGAIIKRHQARPFTFAEFVNTANHIATPSAFYTRHVMERVGWLDACGDDFDLMLRIAKAFDVHCTKQALSRLRVRANSTFNPRDFDGRLEYYRQAYTVSRRHGGRRFSPFGVGFYAHLLIRFLHLRSWYPMLRTLAGRKALAGIRVALSTRSLGGDAGRDAPELAGSSRTR